MKLHLHPVATAQVEALVRAPHGTVLLHGVAGVGKRTAALEIARQLNCAGCGGGTCRSCRQAAGGNHPNIMQVSPDDKHKIGVEAIHRLQHGLQYQQYERQGRRVVVLAEADTLTLPAQNALLKTLEEPPADSVMILTSETPQALLPTVLSRCRLIFIPSLPQSAIEVFIGENYPQADAAAIAAYSQGLLGRAAAYAADPDRLEQDRQLTASVQRLLQESPLLPRLQLAAEAANDTKHRSAYIHELGLQVRAAARQTAASSSAAALLALERLQQRLRANVNPKTAFEAFVVELS